MKTIEIKYNPYLVKSEIKIDNILITKDSGHCTLYDTFNNRRIQDWIDAFLENLSDSTREDKFNIKFYGTKLDAEDVASSVKVINDRGSVNFMLDMAKTKEIIPENKITDLKKLFNESQNGPFDEFRSEDMAKNFNRKLDPSFEVNVIATMSSGKSTVINSLLGIDLLPSENKACTATIAKIEDHDDMPSFEASRFDDNGLLIEEMHHADLKLMSLWNADPKTSEILVKGNIPGVNERKNVRIIFVDTPGPNSARNENHEKVTRKAITSSPLSMVLYILNATQLSTNDDSNLLELVSEAMKTGNRQAQDRFIFVVNRIDDFKPERCESISNALANVEDYLKKKGIENPLIIPTSAELAKLIRIKKTACGKKLTKADEKFIFSHAERFIEEPEFNIFKRLEGQINASCYNRLLLRFNECKKKDDIEGQAELLSGIPVIEELFNDFLSKHALPSKIKDAVDTFKHIAAQAKTLENLNEILSKDEIELAQIGKNLVEFENNEDRIKQAQKFRKGVQDISYTVSEESKKEINLVRTIIKEFQESNEQDFKEDVEPNKARNIIKSFEKRAKSTCEGIHITLEKSAESGFKKQLKDLREGYVKFVEEIIEKEFPKNADFAAKEFQAHIMEMPETDKLIEQNSENKRICVGSHEEGAYEFTWGGFLKVWNMFKTKTVNDYGNKQFINMWNIWQDIKAGLYTNLVGSIDTYEKISKENLTNAKSILLSAMDDIDQKMKDNLNAIKEARSNEEIKKKQIKENKKKIDWFKSFMSKLNNILEV